MTLISVSVINSYFYYIDTYKLYTLFFVNIKWNKNNCHLFMYSQKRTPWDCVIKLHDNPIYKALLWIKKSFKSIKFDLA